jgi:hypothetical protein
MQRLITWQRIKTLVEEVPKHVVTTEAKDGGHETPTNPTITILRDKIVAKVNQLERKIARLRKSNIHVIESFLITFCLTLCVIYLPT